MRKATCANTQGEVKIRCSELSCRNKGGVWKALLTQDSENFSQEAWTVHCWLIREIKGNMRMAKAATS